MSLLRSFPAIICGFFMCVQDGMNKETEGIVGKRSSVEKLTRIMKAELHQVMQHLSEPSTLKEGIKKLYQRFVTTAPSQGVSDSSNSVEDMHRDHQRQRYKQEYQ